MNSNHAAIIDYGLGNLFSIQRACDHVGLVSKITSDRGEIESAAALILPGVGAFGDAMAALHNLDLVGPLKDAAASGKPLFGICLGLQLLFSDSAEFGKHQGLDLIPGSVVRFDNPVTDGRTLKVPQVGWNQILPREQPWKDTLLDGVPEGAFMYFVHSYHAKPTDPAVRFSISRYGNIEFCSAVRHQNIMATQFHPERSGVEGLKIYKNLKMIMDNNR